MKSEFNSRNFITSNQIFFQTLQSDYETISTEQIMRFSHLSWPTAKKYSTLARENHIISEDFKLNSSIAHFIGVAVFQNKIELAIIGLDAKIIPWKNLTHLLGKKFSNFDGILKFKEKIDYSELGETCKLIRELINLLNASLFIKAICFSFEFTNNTNQGFFLMDCLARLSSSCYTPIKDFNLYFNDMNIELYLCSASIARLINYKFSHFSENKDCVYLNISEMGVFPSIIIDNKLYLGNDKIGVRLNKLITEEELDMLVKGNISQDDFNIIQKIILPFYLSISPEVFILGGTQLTAMKDFSNLLFLHKYDINSSYEIGEYIPKFEIDDSASQSLGTALSAMYQYYNWSYTWP